MIMCCLLSFATARNSSANPCHLSTLNILAAARLFSCPSAYSAPLNFWCVTVRRFKIHLLANWYEENAHQHGRRSSSPTRSSRSSSPTRSRHGDSYAFPEQRPAQAHVAMNAMGMRNMNMDVPIIAQGDPLRRWQSPALPRIPGGRMFPTQSPFMGSCLWLALACMIFVCSSMDRIDQAERYRHANGEGAQYANVIKNTIGKQCACTPIAAAIARTNFRSHLSPQRNFRSHLFPQRLCSLRFSCRAHCLKTRVCVSAPGGLSRVLPLPGCSRLEPTLFSSRSPTAAPLHRFTAGIAATAPAQRRPTAATEKLVG